MADQDKARMREASLKKQEQISKIWQAWALGPGKLAIEDLFQYIEQQREMYRRYGENRAMPGPDGKGSYSIDNDTVASLLQNSRGMYIVKTYILNRIDSGVAQPIKQSK